ncbi:HNH endonuclease [Gulosibacter molinativorax]|uniref:HNH endonuclease n=1 Tax=Gulosibacter molinativorax TaxID=256821 RepID=UPI00223F15B4|nr:HNH endonuclease [Gulosibacter molinativorax]
MSTKEIRNGKGHRAYRRKQAALKRRTARENLPCGYGSSFGCGQPIDTTLPWKDRLAFTADHPVALANGGHLVKQDLVPFHRGCNSRKGDAEELDIELWGAS